MAVSLPFARAIDEDQIPIADLVQDAVASGWLGPADIAVMFGAKAVEGAHPHRSFVG